MSSRWAPSPRNVSVISARDAPAIKRGRVELHELQVAQDRPGPIGHRQPVGGGDRGIRGLAVQLPATTGGENRAGRPNDLETPVLVAADDATASVFLVGEQIDGEEILDDLDIRPALDGLGQRVGDGPPGLVAVGVDDTCVGVAAFESRIDPAVHPIEARAPVLQLPDQLRPPADNLLDHLALGEPAARPESVGHVGFERVVLPQH